MDPSMDAAHRGVTALVERGVQRMAGGAATASNIAEVAADGVSGSGQDLPHQEAIQRSVGDHDLSGVHAFVGGAGGAAAEAIGAEAYATGNAVAFRQPPTLHTAAHEAAHVVQQRAGVQLLGGVGRVGDAYEQNADAVADRVVPGGAVTAPLTPLQTAVREASERIRIAWTMGLNLHVQYSRLYRDQTQWDTPQSGGSFRQGLPFWSKVEKLTIHLKTVTDPASADPARRPISQIDMALSEGVTRKFSQCMRVIGSVPNEASGATIFLNANATAAEIAAGQATPVAHRDLWIKVALRRVGPITGPVERDLRVVHELFALSNAFGTVLHYRDPTGFAD
jgi:hypothetical protein